MSLLDRGFVYAIVHVRGGGELGQQWYEDGKFLKKRNTFNDYAAQVPAEPVVLGKMGSSYGIRGWLRVFSSTEDAESIFDYQPW
ncbi:prolyl oligopeptidase family serine peptidase, partial [Salmonella enterica subsp. enterica serovar Kentucky]|nr:prolyl oligopeptidase family serine peptidase [Salmonella enterica subsp. enterica serovar Kentucky]